MHFKYVYLYNTSSIRSYPLAPYMASSVHKKRQNMKSYCPTNQLLLDCEEIWLLLKQQIQKLEK